MPHFTILTNEDGSVRQLLKDGTPHEKPVRLEQLHAIVATYFRIAESNLRSMRSIEDPALLRVHGLQAFLMALTGVEAFTNVFFTLWSDERGNEELRKQVGRHGPLVERLRACVDLAFDASLDDQEMLLAQIARLYALRNRIVHPRWEPASMTIEGPVSISINGLAHNFQASFEDEQLCREALYWCILLVIRVARTAGNKAVDGFCFQWTGQFGLTEHYVLERLGLPTK